MLLSVLPIVLLLPVTLHLSIGAEMKYYSTKYDHLDVEAILNNRRLVKYYSACLLSKGPCSPDGMEFKRMLPEALETNCLRCTEKQKTVTLRTIRRLRKEYPKIWAELAALWDPDDIYVKKFEATYGSQLSNKPSVTTVPTSSSVVFSNRFGGPSNIEQTKVTQPQSSTSSIPQAVASVSTAVPSTTSSTTTTTKTTSSQKFTTNTQTKTSISTKRPRPLTSSRPNVGDRIGSNIDATVQIIKTVERFVTSVAREKLRFVNNMFRG